MSENRSRIAQLDGLRGCAIAAVFLQHAYTIKLLWMGVDLFFVLSGFLITGILVKQKDRSFGRYIGQFYMRRVRRILPPYALLMVIAVVAFHGPWMRYWYLYFGAMNFVTPMRLAHAPIVSPLWSLAVEEQFYLLWPLVIFLLNRKQIIQCAIALLVLAPILRFVCTPLFSNASWVYMLLPFRMDTLAAGALLALLWPQLSLRLAATPRLKWTIAFGCLGVALMSFAGVLILRRFGIQTEANTRVGNTWIYEGTLGIMASAFLFALIGGVRSFFTAWPLMWLGRISYSFYLIHQAALHAFPQMYGLLALAASLTYATVSWFVIEKPILEAKRPEPTVLASTPG